MIPAEKIAATIANQVRHRRGGFHLTGERVSPSQDENEIAPSDLLIPFVESVDGLWPFDVEPTPRAVGQLMELLRACRFYAHTDSKTGIAIVPDKYRARNLGAFDTPEPVVRYIVEAAVGPLCNRDSPPVVIDPACGAGYFLLAALDLLARHFPHIGPDDLAQRFLIGLDLDDVAVALAKRNLARHMESHYGTGISRTVLDRIIIKADALADFDSLPVREGSADAVIGNPPYQFFSGKGSPVALLRKEGRHEEAEKLQMELEEHARRFPGTSHGCRDRYKWFVNRAVEFLHDGGMLGFITPNTWIAYPRYRDLRGLLAQEGKLEAVIDLGSHAFRRAHVPTSILIWRKGSESTGKSFRLARLTRAQWAEISQGDGRTLSDTLENGSSAIITESGDIRDAGEPSTPKDSYHELVAILLDAPPTPHRKPLGEVAIVREGSHAIRAVNVDAPRTPHAGEDYPVLIDKTMADLTSPELGYVSTPESPSTSIKHHMGERFLIRKTGDRLVVGLSPTDRFALAHQNVYVGKARVSGISTRALAGILGSQLLTDLYRASPGGQHHRPLAQLRIHFLRQLPIIVIPDEFPDLPDPSQEEIDRLVSLYLTGGKLTIEPIPYKCPSKRGEISELAGRIKLYHAAIERLTRQYAREPDENVKKALDEMVYHLYGGKTEDD